MKLAPLQTVAHTIFSLYYFIKYVQYILRGQNSQALGKKRTEKTTHNNNK